MVTMEHLLYIPPTTRVQPVCYESLLCQINASSTPYKDNGDYDWDPED
jgi:hypothetical protein